MKGNKLLKAAKAATATRVSKRAREWHKENKWFGKYPCSTSIALQIHEQIIKSGIKADSDKYYDELEAQLEPYGKLMLAEKLGVLDKFLDALENTQHESKSI